MKLYNVANQSWWVPAMSPVTMAVRIQTPEQFRGAIKDKILAIADETSLEQREYLAMITPGAEAEPLSLVTAGLCQLDTLGETVLANDPSRDAEAADEKTALEAIQAQGELTLADFLG